MFSIKIDIRKPNRNVAQNISQQFQIEYFPGSRQRVQKENVSIDFLSVEKKHIENQPQKLPSRHDRIKMKSNVENIVFHDGK